MDSLGYNHPPPATMLGLHLTKGAKWKRITVGLLSQGNWGYGLLCPEKIKEKLLVPLITAYRYAGDEVNMTLARKEANILHEKISDKAYNDEEIIRIISTRSKAQLSATFNHYNDHHGHEIIKDLEADDDDEYLKLLRAAIECLKTPEKYFEKVLRLAIKKLGTDEWDLTRVVATRAEVDMERIKEEYHRRNSVTLDRAIAADTSGDYEKMLLALIGHRDA
ncbi:hypothetical protein H5410_022816 [Solanum commersonii]|uniref:Annexin n=1 Tax=Solanum commersonii TaxID=4109 RepID=A0A9J5ZHV4_SOLCO|nr:hypothetical protein H5410_022816 [Solanum commersonii]